jgi:hypothetical protein
MPADIIRMAVRVGEVVTNGPRTRTPSCTNLGFLSVLGVVASQQPVRANPVLEITPSASSASNASAGVDPPLPGPTDPRPDVPPRRTPPAVPPAHIRAVADLDGLYLWLGPSAGAGYLAASWDSVVGADVAVLRVREHQRLGVIGASIGAARWTARGGGRAWLEAIAGTRVADRTMVGVSAGGIVELSDVEHPRPGAMVGAWVFCGVTPYVRVGVVDSYGAVVELGVHIALPVLRR